MKLKLVIGNCFQWVFLFVLALQIPELSTAQNLKISDFVLFGGNGACNGSNCGVQIGSFSKIQGGSIGSSILVKTDEGATINGNIYSDGTIRLEILHRQIHSI